MSTKLPEKDLELILDHTRELWAEMRGSRIFISGGTGFFGCWLLESFVWANDRLALNASATVLTRNPIAFECKAAHLAAHPSVVLHTGDIRSFLFPDGTFQFIIHGASEANPQMDPGCALECLDTIVQGTRHTLEFARHCGAGKFLLASSGAVYGRQPPEVGRLTEEFSGAPCPVDLRSVYGEGKRLAELLCALYAYDGGLECKIARCFAFIGPHLALDKQFAAGNFIRDGLAGGPIRIQGDGSPFRSYLYAADLAVWLWTILFRGANCQPYNVGSEHDLDIAALAAKVAVLMGIRRPVEISRPRGEGGAGPERYTPSTERARLELGLRETVDLDEAILSTARWHGVSQASSTLGGTGV